MKRKFRLVLAMVLAMTMVMGMSMTVYAATIKPGAKATVYLEDLAPGTVIDVTGLTSLDNGVIIKRRNGESFNVTYASNSLTFSEGSSRTEVPIIGVAYASFTIAENSFYVTPPTPEPGEPSSPVHVHNFQWQTITEPTKDADGLEGEMCSCGATRNTQKLSAYGYALNEYATPMINAAKSGQTITFEFGEWNSFPKEFMAKLVDKSAQNVTFVFHYNWNHVKQEINIPAGTPIDLNFDWYGPAKMAELYGAN